MSDLAALNVARGHERGLPGYIVFRNRPEFHINPKVESFDDLLDAGFIQEDVDNFKKVYQSVHDIDMFPAGMYTFLLAWGEHPS